MNESKKEDRRYRLVLFSESTFEEIRSFQYRPWYLWMLLSMVVVVSLVLTLALLSLAPIRAIFGATDGYVNPQELIDLRQKVQAMEDQSEAQTLYINNLRQLLSGEVIVSTDSAERPLLNDSVYTVKRIIEDSTLRRTYDLNEQLLAITTIQNDPISKTRSLEQLYLIPPISGTISMGFDLKKDHLGLDINAPVNTPVKAITSGHIIYTGWTIETGNTVGIQHDNNIISFYKHNSSLLKRIGSFVQAGEAVAIIGNTGTQSSGPHLHFELWVDGIPVDPSKYINL